ncbi:MAG: hypothetical protein ABL904_02050 [Hyphomicrobiaceae bacterium]
MLAGVASSATDVLVSANEGEFRLGMIERFDRSPGFFAMAAIATHAQPPLVRIVGLVTIYATAWGGAKLHFWLVAAVAGRRRMGALQFEIGRRVIERLAVQLNDVDATSFVIGVAVTAILYGRGHMPAVKPQLLLSVAIDLFVAIETEPRLRLPHERLVARHAVLFQLGVPLDQRPGHHQLFEKVLCLRGMDRWHGE